MIPGCCLRILGNVCRDSEIVRFQAASGSTLGLVFDLWRDVRSPQDYILNVVGRRDGVHAFDCNVEAPRPALLPRLCTLLLCIALLQPR